MIKSESSLYPALMSARREGTTKDIGSKDETDDACRRSKYRFGRTLGAGTYGIVKEADSPHGKVAVKIILKKNVRGNDQIVYDELDMLQRLHHPHIVAFHDWFESRVSTIEILGVRHAHDCLQDKYYIVTQLATGGELFDRICDRGRFTEKDASNTIRQVLEAVDYLHKADVVHRGVPGCAVNGDTD